MPSTDPVGLTEDGALAVAPEDEAVRPCADGDFTLGGSDVHLGDLTVEGLAPIGFSVSEPQFEYGKHTHPTVDVVKGRGRGFSVEAP